MQVLLLALAAIAVLSTPVGGNVEDDNIKTVHVIFMNHLDVGYSLRNLPGHLVSVLNAYFTEYFPRAIKVADTMLVIGYRERFIYTTHPWLVSLYLECPPDLVLSGIKLQCPDTKNRTDFMNAIKQGIITWHAGPMNMENEMMDESMMEFSIQLSMDLDKKFGFQRKYRTVSQRDVPGTTKAIIAILDKMGIAALSIGVNGATCPAAVPPVFLWKSGNQSLITLYHPRGYPNAYGTSPLQPGGLSKKDCVVVTGLDEALCFAFRSDNQGPPMDYKEVLTVYDIVRSQFRNAFVQASTFENFISLLVPMADRLPVVTEEIGDVWIQGSGSDPRKTAEMRAMFRMRADCLQDGTCSMTDTRVYNASRFMLKLAEHTWGSAGNSVNNVNWTNEQFHAMLKQPGNEFEKATLFWDEQRNFTLFALEALGNHSLAKTIKAEFAKFQPSKTDTTGFRRHQEDSVVSCGQFKLKFDSEGALVQLTDASGQDWASADHPVGKFVYHSYSQADFDKFFAATTPYSKDFFLGIGKPKMADHASPVSKYWKTQLDSVLSSRDGNTVTVRLSMADPITLDYYGAPQQVEISYQCASDLDVSVQWFDKVPTRLPEDLNFVFMPVPRSGYKWYVNKIEELVDPLNVVVNGSQRLHGVNRGVYYVNSAMKGLEIASPDVALVNVLTSEDYVSAIPIPLSPIQDVQGMAFNLYNNVWETNYIFWYPYKAEDNNQKFRFTLKFT